PNTKTCLPSHTAPLGKSPVSLLSARSGRHDPVAGSTPAPTGEANWSPAAPPMIRRRWPVHTDTYPSRTPTRPGSSARHEPATGATEDGVEVGWPNGFDELHAPAARESAARHSAHRLIRED